MKIINILIIEDDDFEAILLKEHLEKYQFKAVAIAKSLTAAIEAYHA